MSIVLLLTNCADYSVHDQSFDNCSGDCSCGVSSLCGCYGDRSSRSRI